MPKPPPPKLFAKYRTPLDKRAKNHAKLALIFGGLLVILFATQDFSPLYSSNLAARVLFCETASVTPQERLLVASVMNNRLRSPAFGYLFTLNQIAGQPRAFSSVDDPNNTNWKKTLHPETLTPAELAIWKQCLALINSNLPNTRGPSGRLLVYYHDKSIPKPQHWSTSYYQVTPELTTPHFIFYSILPTKK